LLKESEFHYAGELEATDADEAWIKIERDPSGVGRTLRAGDVIFVGDEYLELNGDGGWRRLEPGETTRALYRLIVQSD